MPFDLHGSRGERDLGIDRVLTKSGRWIDRFLDMVRRLPPGWTGLPERFQEYMGEDQPHHHNAWGGATSAAIRAGLLEKTGRYMSMNKVSSHARTTPEYKRTISVLGSPPPGVRFCGQFGWVDVLKIGRQK